MKLEALKNAIILKPKEVDEKTYGNIIVPDVTNEKNKIGEVVSVGPGCVVAGVGFVPTELKVGAIVVLPTMGFTRFDFDSEEYWIGIENEVLANIGI